MPVEALQHSRRQITPRNVIAASPPRLRPKGPVGPDFFRQSPTATPKPKLSAVERLEADKAKYVKSQVALSKQQQQQQKVTLPIARKPPLNPSTPLWPTRKTPTQPKAKAEGVQLDLKHLSNLISDVTDAPHLAAAVCSPERTVPEASTFTANEQTPAEAQPKAERPRPPPRPDWSTPVKVRLKSTPPARADTSGPSGTIRRVDVMPQANLVKTTRRPPLFIRQPLHPIPLHSQIPLRLAVSNLHLFDPRAAAGSSPHKPAAVPVKPIHPPSPPKPGSPVPSQPLPTFATLSPPSPAITRLSSSSSRKRPSLTRSKSDLSDRFSRAGTELERFFNLCGLDPTELQELTASSSDIVSLARFRSVSAPGSECAGSDRDEDEEEEDPGQAADRVPYGVSVIERNARVIKWLYNVRQAKDNNSKNTNL